jgi:hypothetical protein
MTENTNGNGSGNGPGNAPANGENEPGKHIRYVQFTTNVKHGQMVRFLLASQVRKRFLEGPQHRWRRQVKGAALTGNPDVVQELYFVRGLDTAEQTLSALEENPGHREIFDKLSAAKHTRKLTLMSSYLLARKSENECFREVALQPYLLHVTITLKEGTSLEEFSQLMLRVLPVFDHARVCLLAAGLEYKDNKPKDRDIINIWQCEAAENIEMLMNRLADNKAYYAILGLGHQKQHILRNISRHYQKYPLLSGYPFFL